MFMRQRFLSYVQKFDRKIRKHRLAVKWKGAVFVKFVVQTFEGFSNEESSLVKLVVSSADDFKRFVRRFVFHR